jgi:formylglycine-generating enzyme required for sulfatase activity
VEQVTWNTVQIYLKETGFRLPTEAEWEYACRAGTQTPFYNGSTDDRAVGTLAWYAGNSDGRTHAVGQKAANALGFHDMLGNVWEWVNDWYGSSYYMESPTVNPPGPNSGTSRVLRGGSWYYGSSNTRSSYRSTYGGTGADFGFRVARNP